jgi:hypothetical protein
MDVHNVHLVMMMMDLILKRIRTIRLSKQNMIKQKKSKLGFLRLLADGYLKKIV